MTVVPDAEDDRTPATRLARWSADHDAKPAGAAWLFGGASDQNKQLAELQNRLDDAERRAADAEEALPHLLALGQRTVNGLLTDARARGRQIIEEAREQAALEIEQERRALAREASELDALRMAVAAEAMGLEQIRNELEAGVQARQLGAGAPVTPQLMAPDSVTPTAPLLPPPPSQSELMSVGMDTARTAPSKESPSGRFADAWAAGEDDMMAEAFDRFFAAEIERDPLRDAAVSAARSTRDRETDTTS